MTTGTFSYIDVVALVAGSTVLAALVNQGLTAVRDALKRKRQSSFSALYLAIALESYASECSTTISESETFEASDGYAGKPHGNVPDLPEFSSSIDWQPLGIAATTKAMSFSVEVRNTQAMIRDAWEFGDEDEVVLEVREEAARLGIKALAIASELRVNRSLAAVEYRGEWNVVTFLGEKVRDFADRKRKREAANKQLNEEMSVLAEPHPSKAAEPESTD